MRNAMRRLLGVPVMAAIGIASAAGPTKIAVPDRALWPDPIDSPAAFDCASRAEILMAAHALAESEALPSDALAARIGVKAPNAASINKARARDWQRLFANYRLASASCTAGTPFCAPAREVAAFRRLAARGDAAAGPAAYAAWRADALRFHRTYLDERLRLAALFPRITSEIDRFGDVERDGTGLSDRQFQLTFDDGPTARGGDTDRTLAMLREARIDATFYVLGDALQRRIDAKAGAAPAAMYVGMCVGAHGWQHVSHQSAPQWQDSVTRSIALARRSTGAAFVPLFRPPYGQRRADSGTFFEASGLHVALWNIDSQDWNRELDAAAVQQRVLSLMLLWRRGTILFHDVHPKAVTAVPWLLQRTRGAGLSWVDCHDAATGR